VWTLAVVDPKTDRPAPPTRSSAASCGSLRTGFKLTLARPSGRDPPGHPDPPVPVPPTLRTVRLRSPLEPDERVRPGPVHPATTARPDLTPDRPLYPPPLCHPLCWRPRSCTLSSDPRPAAHRLTSLAVASYAVFSPAVSLHRSLLLSPPRPSSPLVPGLPSSAFYVSPICPPFHSSLPFFLPLVLSPSTPLFLVCLHTP